MVKKLTLAIAIVMASGLAGCASVPTASQSEAAQGKLFPAPSSGNAGLYVYRDSFVGEALKKDVFVDGKCLGQSANKVFFYEQVVGDEKHTISTESEFSPNQLVVYMKAGMNYFVRQYIKMGVFVGGANLEVISEDKGKSEVSALDMATKGQCSK